MSLKFTRKHKDFIDVSLAFEPNPVTGDITLLKNDRSIQNAMKNCVLFSANEVPFVPDFGSTINGLLFELDDVFTEREIILEVTRTIEYNEPRVEVIEVNTVGQRDKTGSTQFTKESNAVYVQVVYKIIGFEDVLTTEFLLTSTSA